MLITQYLKRRNDLAKWAKDLNRHFKKKDIQMVSKHINM